MKINFSEISEGVTKYLSIMAYIDPNNDSFKKRFTSVYKIRGRSDDWMIQYYKYFAELQNQLDREGTLPTFEEALNEMLVRGGTIEPVYVSKMLSTLDPSRPLFDKHVLKAMGVSSNFPAKAKTTAQKVKYCVNVYLDIEKFFTNTIRNGLGVAAIMLFDSKFPASRYPLISNISEFKKIDFILSSVDDKVKLLK